ncbi:STY4528 family pathogenicity island replication protein [Aquisalimonas asiatica]|uniref:Uncharacterized protein n=1 Tax=Aquisalimonas asiatica TaxID=406100 RepID=A0A1H8T186_9GAMM|nr:STY4528 family pathogenicity island replication protein [Aquisalimonas asiatica]SEO84263.1 hypothetical protein SAMN04488052_103318 [Aquisalimonas asiatica]
MATDSASSARPQGLQGAMAEAARQLCEAPTSAEATDSDGGAVLYAGNWQDTHPRRLLYDPALEARDKIAWMVIKAHSDPRTPAAFPSYHDFAAAGVGSKPTIAASIALLRITRWISLCQQVRDEKGRYRGNIYALHDEPVCVAEAMELDEGYVGFVREMCNHYHSRVRMVAEAVLATIRAGLMDGTEFTDSQDFTSRFEIRLSAHQANADAFATGAFGAALRGHHGPPEADRSQVAGNAETTAAQVHQMNPDTLVSELNSACDDRVKPLNPVNTEEKSRTSSQVKQLNRSRARRGSSGSSSQTTTTGGSGTSGADGDEQSPLEYPRQLTKDQRELARLCLGELDPEAAQQVLDELAGCLEDRERTPIRNPIRYLSKLARAARNGTFVPTYSQQRRSASAPSMGPGSPPPPARPSQPENDQDRLSRRRGAEELAQLLKAAGKSVPAELAAQLGQDHSTKNGERS